VADDHESPSTAAVAGLASEVETMRSTITRLQGLGKDVGQLSRLVRELTDQVDALSRKSVPVKAPTWLDLAENKRGATLVLRDLVEWLGMVFLRYPDAEQSLPECWLWHPAVVEELLWLRHAWQAAYRDEGATVQLAGDWHDRYRPGVIRRIKHTAQTCSLDKHAPYDRGGQDDAPPVVPLASALEQIADWWAANRAGAAPEPTAEQLDHMRELGWGGGRR